MNNYVLIKPHFNFRKTRSFHCLMACLIGITGRESAGKSTIAEQLCGPTPSETYTIRETKGYVLEILFGERMGDESRDMEDWTRLMSMFRQTIDTDFSPPEFCIAYKPSKPQTKVQMSFAGPLKKLAAVLLTFTIPGPIYDILRGVTEHDRVIREKITTIKYNICGVLTGRKALEYLGTDVFRNNFDKDIWVTILDRERKKYKLVVMADVRFPNEKDYIEANGGTIIVVYDENPT